jgi:hypothetical protein
MKKNYRTRSPDRKTQKEPPIYGKDCNDYLQNMIRQKHSRQMGRE